MENNSNIVIGSNIHIDGTTKNSIFIGGLEDRTNSIGEDGIVNFPNEDNSVFVRIGKELRHTKITDEEYKSIQDIFTRLTIVNE